MNAQQISPRGPGRFIQFLMPCSGERAVVLRRIANSERRLTATSGPPHAGCTPPQVERSQPLTALSPRHAASTLTRSRKGSVSVASSNLELGALEAEESTTEPSPIRVLIVDDHYALADSLGLAVDLERD